MISECIQYPLRIGSYNIRKAVGLDRKRDPARSAAVMAGLGADIVAVQEVDLRLGQRPAALTAKDLIESTDYKPVPLARNDVSLGWHGNALLVRDGVRTGQTLHIPLTSPDPRGAILVEIEAPVRMTVVAVHLSLFRYARRRQLAEIRQVLDARPPRPSVIVGDFNEWRTNSGLETLEGAYSVVSPGKSFHAARPIAGLDRLALGRGVALANAGVEQGQLARRASDHLPIWADISVTADTPVKT